MSRWTERRSRWNWRWSNVDGVRFQPGSRRQPASRSFGAGFALLLFLLFLGSGCSQTPDEGGILLMSGAANQPPISEIAALYERETGVPVHLVYGGGGTLLSQIELSHKGDVYLPGSPDFIYRAQKKGLIFADSIRPVCYLVPAIIVPRGNPGGITSLEDLGREGVRVGIGNPECVCIGVYAVELLAANGLLERVMKNVVVYGGSCAKTVNLVLLGRVDAIIGWRMLKSWNPDKLECVPISKSALPRISYVPVSIPTCVSNRKQAEHFIAFVLSEKGQRVYRRWGYLTDRRKALALARSGAAVGGQCVVPKSLPRIAQ